MLSYKNVFYFLNDFEDSPNHTNLLGGMDCCGDPSFTVSDTFFVNKRNSEDKIVSIIVQNNKMDEVSFSLDNHVINVAAACGFEIFRKGDYFILKCDCFPLLLPGEALFLF